MLSNKQRQIKGLCEKHRVTFGRCERKATFIRKNSKGFYISLCRECDDAFGEVIGTLVKAVHQKKELTNVE